jgi:hypothetical protein
MSAEEQATRARTAYEAFLPGGRAHPCRDRLGPYFWFCVRDRARQGDGGVNDHTREDSFGLVTPEWTHRFPAFDAVKTALAKAVDP